MRNAVFLDRDGVINRKAPEGQYITRWEEMEFLPGVEEAIALLRGANQLVIVISNQRCVAKGLISEEELEGLHQRMRGYLERAGAPLDAVYYCPHEVNANCSCRKPAPGMIERAAQEHRIDLSGSWMVGDSDSDIQAGRAAGCKTVRIMGPGGQPDSTADVCAASLLDAARTLTSRRA